MGNKYAKLICAVAGLLLIAVLQYQELSTYYKEKLSYLKVQMDQPDCIGKPKTNDIRLDELVDQKNSGGIQHNKKELEALALYENEINQDKQQAVDSQTAIPSYLKLNAIGSVLMDADSGRVLYGENYDKELAMASTTKIMTCIVALEHGNMNDVVTVSKKAASMPDVQLNMLSGEQFYLHDLLYSLMLESHNDSAVAIAEHIGGSVEGFAEMMNQKAKELGLTHTNFVTPNGLDADGHYTTPRELGIIASYALKNEAFLKITNTLSYEFHEITKNKCYVVNNKNRFLYMMDGAIGVKTGFTNNAGYCFVGALKRDDRTFISVVLGSGWPPNKTFKWSDTTALMNYGLNYFKRVQLINKLVEFDDLYVAYGQSDKTPIYTQGHLSTLVRTDETVQAQYVVPKCVKAPVKAGQQVGELRFYVNDQLYQSFPIYAKKDVKKVDLSYCLDQVLDGFCFLWHE